MILYMFYYLYLELHQDFHVFNLFHYITFRTAYASMTALFLSLALGPWLIRKLKEFQIGQYHSRRRAESAPSEGGNSHHGRRADPSLHRYSHAALVGSQQHFCVAHFGHDAGFWGHRVLGRLPEDPAPAEQGADGARKILASDSGEFGLRRHSGFDVGARPLLHHSDLPLFQAPAPDLSDNPFSGKHLDFSLGVSFPSCSLLFWYWWAPPIPST